MKSSRRQFLEWSSLTAVATALARMDLRAAEKAAEPSFAKGKSGMHLGMVTYNLGKDWDIPTIIKNCTDTGFEGVELRAGHRHGVELALGPAQRAEVRRRFEDSPVKLWSLGSAYDFHTPNQAKLRQDIAEAKQYIALARDVGATGVKVRPNGLPPEVPIESTLDQIGRSLGELGDVARDHGLQIRLEIHGTGTSLVPHIKHILDAAHHPAVGACWNCNQTDLAGAGFDANFDLVRERIFTVHLRDLFVEEYPFRRLFKRLGDTGFHGFTFAEIPESTDPVRVMRYFRALWLSYQGLL